VACAGSVVKGRVAKVVRRIDLYASAQQQLLNILHASGCTSMAIGMGACVRSSIKTGTHTHHTTHYHHGTCRDVCAFKEATVSASRRTPPLPPPPRPQRTTTTKERAQEQLWGGGAQPHNGRRGSKLAARPPPQCAWGWGWSEGGERTLGGEEKRIVESHRGLAAGSL
jgi:hypothetical protein